VPTFRLRLRTLLLLPVAAAALVWIGMMFSPPVPLSGERPYLLDFLVVDARSGQLIDGAVVEVSDIFDAAQRTSAQARPDGRVQVSHGFPVTGERRLLRTTGTVSFQEHWLKASARGHVDRILLLTDVIAREQSLGAPPPTMIRLALAAGKTPDPAVTPIAGDYVREDGARTGPWGLIASRGGSQSLRIEPDGRFSFRWGTNFGTYAKNYGLARVTDGVLNLSPILGKEATPSGMDTRFFPVAWGGRSYLLREEDLLSFCNDVNLGTEPRQVASGTGYLRQGDWNTQVSGWPQLPTEWMPYVLTKPIRGQIIELLDANHARISLGSKDGIRDGMQLFVACEGLMSSVRVDSVDVDRSTIGPDSGQGKIVLGELLFKVGNRVGLRLDEDQAERVNASENATVP
jgi:hypothetical protein